MLNILKILYLENPQKITAEYLGTIDKQKYTIVDDEYEQYYKLLLQNGYEIPEYLTKTPIMPMFLKHNNYFDPDEFDYDAKYFVGRLGSTEISAVYYYIDNYEIDKSMYSGKRSAYDFKRKQLWELSGIYPLEYTYLHQFASEYYNTINNTTHMFNVKKNMVESYLIYDCENIIENALLKPTDWFIKLQNKKILIISSHVDYIKKQWDDDKSFKCHNIDMTKNQTGIELIFIKMPVASCFNAPHKNWTETFNYIIGQINDIDYFDIALVSAGGYGMLLCNYIYTELNRSAIYVGSELQLFFGIKGNRYSKRNIYNEYWIEMLEIDKPKNYMLCENGAHW